MKALPIAKGFTVLAVLWVVLVPGTAWAQANPPPTGAAPPPSPDIVSLAGQAPAPMPPPAAAPQTFIPTEFVFAILILLFGFGVVFLEYLVFRRQTPLDTESFTRAVAITLIIVSTLFVAVASVQDVQISSAVGLFGTIAGYLVGKTEPRAAAAQPNPPPQPGGQP